MAFRKVCNFFFSHVTGFYDDRIDSKFAVEPSPHQPSHSVPRRALLPATRSADGLTPFPTPFLKTSGTRH